MLNQFSRTQPLLGRPAMDTLAASRVAVFGIGGVGGHVCEALVRSGVGAFDLIDDETLSILVHVDKIEDETVAMERDDQISAVLDTLAFIVPDRG